MKRMKNIIWAILIAISIVGSFSGCKKFLDRKPLSATLDDIPGGGVEGQILGLYGAIRHPDASGNGFGGISVFPERLQILDIYKEPDCFDMNAT